MLLQEEFGKRRSLEKQNLKTTAAGIRGETPGVNIHPQKYGGLEGVIYLFPQFLVLCTGHRGRGGGGEGGGWLEDAPQ